MDTFDKVRETLWGVPGFQRRESTVQRAGWSFVPGSTYVVETLATDEGITILLQMVGETGGQRIVLPPKVVEAIYRHRDSITKKRVSLRGQRAAETRKAKGIEPFKRREIEPAAPSSN